MNKKDLPKINRKVNLVLLKNLQVCHFRYEISRMLSPVACGQKTEVMDECWVRPNEMPTSANTWGHGGCVSRRPRFTEAACHGGRMSRRPHVTEAARHGGCVSRYNVTLNIFWTAYFFIKSSSIFSHHHSCSVHPLLWGPRSLEVTGDPRSLEVKSAIVHSTWMLNSIRVRYT